MKLKILGVLVIAGIIGLSGIAQAEGQYDGIWSTNFPVGDLIIIEKNGQLLVVLLADDMHWETYSGTLIRNSATLITMVSAVEAVFDITFTSPSTASITQVSCRPVWPGYVCLLPVGITFQATKKW